MVGDPAQTVVSVALTPTGGSGLTVMVRVFVFEQPVVELVPVIGNHIISIGDATAIDSSMCFGSVGRVPPGWFPIGVSAVHLHLRCTVRSTPKRAGACAGVRV